MTLALRRRWARRHLRVVVDPAGAARRPSRRGGPLVALVVCVAVYVAVNLFVYWRK